MRQGALFAFIHPKILFVMEIIRDHNGVDITNDLRLIWMIETVKVIGGGGTEKYFIKRRQYRYSAIVENYDEIPCEPCEDTMRGIYYRVVDENDENFDVPAASCVLDDKPRKVWEQDFYSRMEHLSDQPKDVIKEYKDLTGIDLSDQNMPVTNGGKELWEENKRKRNENQGKQYGQVELREEFPH